MYLSICIPTPATPERLELMRRQLASLQYQDAIPEHFEVIVAIDGPDEGDLFAAKLAEICEPASFALTFVRSARPEGDEIPHRNHARNAAWRAARGLWCWILDGDFLLPPHAIRHALAELTAATHRGRPAILTPCMGAISGTPAAWLKKSKRWMFDGRWPELLDKIGELGDVHSGFGVEYVPGPPGSHRLKDCPEGMPIVPRAVLEALGGFDEGFIGWGGQQGRADRSAEGPSAGGADGLPPAHQR